MNQKELTKTFMTISNWKNRFGFDVFYKLIQRSKGFEGLYTEQLLYLVWASYLLVLMMRRDCDRVWLF